MNLLKALRILFHRHKWGMWLHHSVFMGDDYEERQCLICGAIEEHEFADDTYFVHLPETKREKNIYSDLS